MGFFRLGAFAGNAILHGNFSCHKIQWPEKFEANRDHFVDAFQNMLFRVHHKYETESKQ